MPFINVKIAAPEPSEQQKEQIIAEITDVMVRVLGKKPERVMVMLETLPATDIGVGGESVANIAKKAAK